MIQQRYVMAIMMQLALWNAYHLRVVVNIAMAEMKAPTNHSRIVDACPNYKDEYVKGIQGGRYEWSSTQESWILSGFYCGYLFSHLPGGWLADKLGARHVMGFCIITSSIVTFFYPLCIETKSFALAVFMRVLVGLLQGPIYPCLSTFIQCWAPPSQRAFLGGVAYGGSNLGAITGNVLTGYIIQWTQSWKTPFYIWAFFGMTWYVFYLFMVFSRPDSHPFITKEELDYLEKEVPKRAKFKVPWKAIMKSGPNYALIAGQFGHDYLFFTVLTDLPKYMKDILKLNIKQNAVFTALPFLFIWISSILSAYFADFLTNRGIMSVLTARRVWTAFSALIPAALLILVVYIGCNRTMAIIIYSLLMFLHGPFYSGMKVNVNDITRYYGGSIMAIVNGIGAIAGILGPAVIGYITVNHSLEEWRLVMWIMLGVMSVTTILYWIFTSTERQPWDYPEEEGEEAEEQ